MQTQIKNVYTHLQDDLSRKIFENRLLHSFTRKDEFIKNIVNLSFPVDEYRRKIKLRFQDAPLIIYGAGFVGASFWRCCDAAQITAFCDSAEEKHGSVLCGHKVISPAELKESYGDSTVVIAVFKNKAAIEIKNTLACLGFSEEKIVDFNTVIALPVSLRRAYFSDEIILPLLADDEVFIDAGCYDFRTSLRFAEYSGGKYQKIIAFEPNPKQYPLCVENSVGVGNAVVHPYGLWDENTELNFNNANAPGARISDASENTVMIKAVKLDDILNGERATFIKMDIEGAELNALRGAERTISQYRPKLAICVYHKPEDIWEIPSYILSLHGDYRLFLRHYSLGAGETVLYAV